MSKTSFAFGILLVINAVTLPQIALCDSQNVVPMFDYSSFLAENSDAKEQKSVPDNVCIKKEADGENFDYESLDDKEKLLRFIDGPCSPVILVPGVLATKMQVEIDCETFQKAHPAAFEECGWNTCHDVAWYELWKRKPNKLYNMWIPDIFSPMSVVANELHPKCFEQFFTLNYDPSKADYSNRYTTPDGVLLRYFNQTAKEPKGGLDAIGDLDPKPKQPYLASNLLYWEQTRRKLNKMGYQDGLTLFGSPYDWRRSPISNEARFTLRRTLEFLKKTTGKSTIVYAHSMGNMQMLYNMNQMTAEDKERLVRHYVSVMPPFAGSTKAALFLLGGSNVDPYGLGIPLEAMKKVDQVSSALYDLYPKPSYEMHQDEPFFQDLMKRIKAEQEHPTGEDGFWPENKSKLPYSWIPTPDESCSNDNLVNRAWKGCSIGIKNLAEEVLIKVQDREYRGTAKDRKRFMSTQEGAFVSPEFWKPLMEEVKADGLDAQTNPGVETTLVYNASVKTMYGLRYNYDAKANVEKGEWSDPDSELYEMGDGTVNISTALFGPLKWAWEFEQQVKSGKGGPAKGVKLVEYCSTYESSHDFDYSKPSYEGLYCRCLDYEQEGKDCDHVFSLNDDYLIEYFADLAVSLKNPTEDRSFAEKLTEKDIKKIYETCPPLNDPVRGYNAGLLEMKNHSA